MNAFQVVVQGTLKPDGTLELKESPKLQPGPVEVLSRPQPTANGGAETWWEFLQHSRAELLAAGHAFRAKEDIDSDRARQRSTDEPRRQAIKHAQTPEE